MPSMHSLGSWALAWPVSVIEFHTEAWVHLRRLPMNSYTTESHQRPRNWAHQPFPACNCSFWSCTQCLECDYPSHRFSPFLVLRQLLKLPLAGGILLGDCRNRACLLLYPPTPYQLAVQAGKDSQVSVSLSLDWDVFGNNEGIVVTRVRKGHPWNQTELFVEHIIQLMLSYLYYLNMLFSWCWLSQHLPRRCHESDTMTTNT